MRKIFFQKLKEYFNSMYRTYDRNSIFNKKKTVKINFSSWINKTFGIFIFTNHSFTIISYCGMNSATFTHLRLRRFGTVLNHAILNHGCYEASFKPSWEPSYLASKFDSVHSLIHRWSIRDDWKEIKNIESRDISNKYVIYWIQIEA